MQRRLLFIILVSLLTNTYALSQVSDQEASLKAAFIYNFTKYIQWDEKENATSFVIGIIGNSGIRLPLEKIAQSNTVNGRKIIIRHFANPDAIEYCNILFIPQKIPYSLSLILEKINKGTLTVSEEPGFAKLGSAFNFIIKDDKLKFEANLKSIYAANVKVSSQLLKLAIIID